jgi:phenylalanyl-tRNA synthetase beta chain
VVGELHPRVLAAFELPARTVAGELRLDVLVAEGITAPRPVAPSALPGARFDVAVIVSDGVPAAQVEHVVRTAAGEQVTACELFDVYTGEQVGEGAKSLAYALRLDDPERQLTDADVTAAIERIVAAVEADLGGRLRR